MTKTIELEKRMAFEPHPNVIFATKVDKTKTESGIILPEGSDDMTPIVKLMAIGENVEKQFKETGFSLEKGDYVYIDHTYIKPAIIDGVKGIMLMADAIIGKVVND